MGGPGGLYSSDLKSKASTVLIVLGFRRGLRVAILLGYCLIPLMALVGLMFKLGAVYYGILAVLVAFVSRRILRRRRVLLGEETETMCQLSSTLARDFVIIAVRHTTNLTLSSYLKTP